jgi:hypothetical protein
LFPTNALLEEAISGVELRTSTTKSGYGKILGWVIKAGCDF